jgi:hypothetical protein
VCLRRLRAVETKGQVRDILCRVLTSNGRTARTAPPSTRADKRREREVRTNTNGHKLCTKATHHSCGLLGTASARGRCRRASVVRATRPGLIGFVDSPDIRVVFMREAACAVELHARRRGREYVEPTEPVHVGYGSAIEPSIPKPSITLHHHKTTNSPNLAHRLLSNLRPQQPTGRAVPRIPRAGTRRTSACSRASTSTATPAAVPCTSR